MSLNGRRRWRKWIKRQRYVVRGICGEPLKDVKMRKAIQYPDCLQDCWLSPRGENGEILHIADKPFTPRSLVGMTQGARKRKRNRMTWQFMFDLPEEESEGGFWKADKHRREVLTPMMRIGERLRPCPGCKQCGLFRSWRSGSLRGKDIEHICDGSGVLPARGKGK